MHLPLLAAGLLALLIGVIHSLLGERLIFRHLRRDGLVPTLPAPPLSQRHVRILWATWHIGSVFGAGFAALLLAAAFHDDPQAFRSLASRATALAYLASALLVLVGTRARHPGWIGLGLVALLVGWGAR